MQLGIGNPQIPAAKASPEEGHAPAAAAPSCSGRDVRLAAGDMPNSSLAGGEGRPGSSERVELDLRQPSGVMPVRE
jgi:hypothetical protein